MSKKIKSITLFKYDFINRQHSIEESNPKGYKFSYTALGENGNLLMETKYNVEGEIEEKDVYAFDNEGRLKEEISYLSNEEIAEHMTFEYDAWGNLAQAFKLYADGLKDRIQYNYDVNGNLITKTTFDSDNEAEVKEVLEWENKKLVKKEVYEFGKLVSTESNRFDDHDNVIEASRWTAEDGNIRTEYFYNEKNDLIKTLVYNNEDKLVSKTLYTYDEKGKLVLADYESVKNKNITTILYDEKGNAIEQTESDPNGEINNKAIRKFNDQNEVIETSVIIDLHGRGLNQEYLLTYEYEYYDH